MVACQFYSPALFFENDPFVGDLNFLPTEGATVSWAETSSFLLQLLSLGYQPGLRLLLSAPVQLLSLGYQPGLGLLPSAPVQLLSLGYQPGLRLSLSAFVYLLSDILKSNHSPFHHPGNNITLEFSLNNHLATLCGQSLDQGFKR